MKYQHKKYHHWKRFTESEDYLDYARFVRTCNSVRSLTRTLSKAFEHDPVKKLKKNSEAFWSYANSRLKTRTKIFADDTKVNNCVKDYKGVEELESDIDSMAEFGNKWQLPFNNGKCKSLNSGRTSCSHVYSLNGHDLEQVH